MSASGDDPMHFTKARAVAAGGAWIGFVTCERCGAAVMLDMQIDALNVHSRWHREQDEARG